MPQLTSHLSEYFIVYFFGTYLASICTFSFIEVMHPRRHWQNQTHRKLKNLVIAVFNFTVALTIPVSSISAAFFAHTKGLGLFNNVTLLPAIQLLIVVPLWSLLYWCHHVWLHTNPILWRIHRLHHSDRHLDATTTLRINTLEIFTPLLFEIPLVLLLGVPAWILMLYKLVMFPVHFFNHSNIALPTRWNHWMSYVLVTPNTHRLHHAKRRELWNRNFATEFAIWDHLFGTYVEATDEHANEDLGV